MSDMIPENSIYIKSDEEDENEDEEGNYKDSGDESDGSGSSSSSSGRGRSSSFTTTWPQSLRQSTDMYIGVTPPKFEFFNGAPSLTSQSSSFFSKFGGPLIKPLLPATTISSDQAFRQSSHSLLPPSKDVNDQIKLSAPRKSSYGQAVLIGMNLLCGVGLLTTPYAVKEGGWLSLLILLLFAVLAFYTGILLRRCMDSEPGLQTYPDIGQAAFGTKGRLLISIVLYVDLYISCVEYIILESDNLSSLFPNAQINIGGLHINSSALFAIITTLVVLPTTWLRDLSLLSYVSAGGVIAAILVAASLSWIGLIDHVGFKAERSMLNLSGLPISIGLFGFCFAGHAVFPNIYSSLKHRNQYPSVLFTSFFFTTIMFGGVAIIGYFMFGESTLSEFTLSMPQNLVASKFALWTTVVTPIAKYAVTFMPIALGFEEFLPKNHLNSRSHSLILRTAMVFSTLLVALTVPFFGLVMAFSGSFLAMLMSFIFPCICFISIVRDKVTWIQLSICTLTIAVGVISAVVGTYASASKILQELL